MSVRIIQFLCLIIVGLSQDATFNYLWLGNHSRGPGIIDFVSAPPGYERDSLPESCFADWLRHLPLKAGDPPIRLYNGQLKSNQKAHYAVIDIDIGSEDLQQCADAVIRLRAEYLYSIGQFDSIHFNFTSGENAAWRKWIEGYRPVVGGGNVFWRHSNEPDSSYAGFRKYLKTVFAYAGTYSLQAELPPVDSVALLQIGDVFIDGGFPGHAVIVVDMVRNPQTGKKAFILAQSFMPAQDIHILINPADTILSPWFDLDFGDTLYTPEWRFSQNQIKRF